MKKRSRHTLFCAAFLVLGYAAFLFWPVSDAEPNLRLDATHSFGNATKSSDVFLAISPFMEALDYRSANALLAKLDGYLNKAVEQDLSGKNRIIVFPEHLGTWLVAENAPAAAFAAPSTSLAMATLIMARPVSFLRAFHASDEDDAFAAAIFRMQGQSMARSYQHVFSSLAKRYEAYVVAGSIVLENPRIRDGVLETQAGPLFNMSAVFLPDGRLAPKLVRKAYPIPSETPFTASAKPSDLPVFDTALGPLAVLICADTWHPDLYTVLAQKGAELLAGPAFLQPSGVWEKPWGGYTTPWPDDVPRDLTGKITEKEAWISYSAAGRIKDHTSIRAAISPFLRGDLWDLGSDGQIIATDGQNTYLGARTDGAVIAALRLPPSSGH